MTEFASRAPVPAPFTHLRVEIELAIPSDVRYIESVVERVTRECTELDYPARQCHLNVPVALTEALSNAILRGNGGDALKHVRVRARLDERAVVLEVEDQGAGFDLDACTVDASTEDNLLREDGRGLFLMRRLMDRVERFNHRNQHGNVVRLTLLRP
jgi:serine/threonine-protein kinase RsbW